MAGAAAEEGILGAAIRAMEARGLQNIPIKEFREALNKAPTFDEAKSNQDFRQHLVKLKKWMALFGVVTDAQRKMALVYTIDGASALRVAASGCGFFII